MYHRKGQNSHIIRKDESKKGMRIIPMFRSSRCFLVLRPTEMDLVLYLTDSARYKIVPRYLKVDENCFVFTVDLYWTLSVF